MFSGIYNWFISKVVALFGGDYNQLLLVLFMVNSGLTMLSSFVDKAKDWLGGFKDKTSSDIDNKADGLLSKFKNYIILLLSYLQKIIDILSANKKH